MNAEKCSFSVSSKGHFQKACKRTCTEKVRLTDELAHGLPFLEREAECFHNLLSNYRNVRCVGMRSFLTLHQRMHLKRCDAWLTLVSDSISTVWKANESPWQLQSYFQAFLLRPCGQFIPSVGMLSLHQMFRRHWHWVGLASSKNSLSLEVSLFCSPRLRCLGTWEWRQNSRWKP